jgi:leucyl aminopeptidase
MANLNKKMIYDVKTYWTLAAKNQAKASTIQIFQTNSDQFVLTQNAQGWSLPCGMEKKHLCLSHDFSPGYSGLEFGRRLSGKLLKMIKVDRVQLGHLNLSFDEKWKKTFLQSKDFLEGFVVGLLGPSKGLKGSLSIDFLTQKQVESYHQLMDALFLCFSLIQTPPNFKTPVLYRQKLEKIFSDDQLITEFFSADVLKAKGFELISAVGGKSGGLLVVRPKKMTKKPLVLIGKGVTYDTGGVCLKTYRGMRDMKKDMGGSAAVCSLTKLLNAHQELNLPIVSCFPIAENTLREDSFRPGDVYWSGDFTVEIDHTDAEGRLLLADAIGFAKKFYNPESILTVATLTGAARVALGPSIDPCYTNQKKWENLIKTSSQKTGDWMWQMPLYTPYASSLDSDVADFMNTSPFKAGSLEAALFLKKFIGETPWLHIDTYMWNDQEHFLGKPGPAAKTVRFCQHFFSALYGAR